MTENTPDTLEILDAPDLSIYEKMVYIIVQSNDDFPSYSDIAKKGSMSRRQAIYCVNSLVEKGMLRKPLDNKRGAGL